MDNHHEILICFLYFSGYADRIHELLVISRELSLGNDKSLMKTSQNNNYFSEANYIEFSGVRVRTIYLFCTC